MEFKIEKKGYSVSQVDAYILQLKSEYEKSLARQKERIDELKRALESTENSIKAYKEKSSLVTKAIYNAVAKAEEIERLSQIKYNQEIEQLKAFHDKWVSYYNKILERYPLDEELMAASKFNNRMRNILAGGESESANYEKMPVKQLEENYEKETERLREKRIGYVTVKTQDGDESDDKILREMLPDGDMDSPILSGNFDPIERINRYFSSEKAGRKDGLHARKTDKAEEKREISATATPFADGYSDRSESGFSFEEALNPKEDLSEIMKELGLFSDD